MALDFTWRTTLPARRASAVISSAVGWRLRHDLEVVAVDGLLVAVLDQHAADDGTDFAAGASARQADLGAHEAQVLLLAEDGEGVGVECRRDDHFGEDLGDGLGEALVDGAVGDDDAAEGRLRSVSKALCQASRRVSAEATPQGLVCFRIADRGALELADEVGRGGDIEDVVIAEFLALQLVEGLVERAVEGGLLVRVLAVARARWAMGSAGGEAGRQAEDVAEAGLGLRIRGSCAIAAS
jgi:hypothetical protein